MAALLRVGIYASVRRRQSSYAFWGSWFGCPGLDFIAAYRVNTVSKTLYVNYAINQTNVAAVGKVATLEVTVDELPAGDPPIYSMPITGAAITDNNGYLIPMGGGATATMQVFEYLAQEQAPLLNAKVLLQAPAIFIGSADEYDIAQQ